MAFSVIQGPVSLVDNNAGNALDVEIGVAIPAGTRSIIMGGSDGTNARYLRMATDGTVRIDPTGTTTQPVSGTITANQGGTWNINNISGTISLPTGAATSALQTAGNSSLSSIDTKTPALGQAAMASSSPVVIASNQSAIPINDNSGSLTVDNGGTFAVQAAQSGTWNITNISGTVSLPTGAATEATLATLLTTTAFQARINTLGQKTMANSTPVVFASDQTSLTVSTASSSATGAAVPSSATMVAGTDGANLRAFAVDPAGIQYGADLGEAIGRGRVTGIVGNISGNVSTNGLGKVLVTQTAYVEQTAGAQRSVSSSSANDTSAGTGARTIKITYYTLTAGVIAGPLTETITMNGTTAVNTVGTNICFIEKMEVLTVGSVGANVGTISLFASTAGGGGTIMSMPLTLNTTRTAHHYVPDGSRCLLYDFFFQNDAISGNNSRFAVEVVNPASVNNAERPVIWVRVDGRSSGNVNASKTPLAVTGPARINIYVSPANTAVQESTVDLRYEEI